MCGQSLDFTVPTLGHATIPSPLGFSNELGDLVANYTADEERVLYAITGKVTDLMVPKPVEQMLELAGPRERIFFRPLDVHAGIITCGGLCPGLNDVIRAIVMCLMEGYGVPRVTGIRFGYRGLLPEFGLAPLALTPKVVTNIHRAGGALLGSSRGHGKRVVELVDSIELLGVNMLIIVGGDGTQRGALDISDEGRRRGLKLAVVGVPKTIDNDLNLVDKTFGFDTAVSLAAQAVTGTHVEAHDAVNGIGIIKLMGREAGFIAAHAALAVGDADAVLIPEVPFDLDGEKGLLAYLEGRLEEQGHALVVVAEGAGQEHLLRSSAADASGNRKLEDVGQFLKAAIATHFGSRDHEVNIKYVDPSYIIRSAPADPHDSLYCAFLGRHAAHAAMSGKSGVLVSFVNGQFVHVPIRVAAAKRKTVDPDGALWRNVLESTGQPPLMKNGS